MRQLQHNPLHYLPLLNQQIHNHVNHLKTLQGQQDQVQNLVDPTLGLSYSLGEGAFGIHVRFQITVYFKKQLL